MITGIRSAVICDKVEQSVEYGMSLIGLRGDRLIAESRPGFISCWLVLQAETDGRASLAQISLSAKHYAPPPVSFNPPANVTLTAAAFPLFIPVLHPGVLLVGITDAGRRLKPFQIRWRMDFSPNAQILGPDAEADILKTADESIAALYPSLEAQASGGRRPS